MGRVADHPSIAITVSSAIAGEDMGQDLQALLGLRMAGRTESLASDKVPVSGLTRRPAGA